MSWTRRVDELINAIWWWCRGYHEAVKFRNVAWHWFQLHPHSKITADFIAADRLVDKALLAPRRAAIKAAFQQLI